MVKTSSLRHEYGRISTTTAQVSRQTKNFCFAPLEPTGVLTNSGFHVSKNIRPSHLLNKTSATTEGLRYQSTLNKFQKHKVQLFARRAGKHEFRVLFVANKLNGFLLFLLLCFARKLNPPSGRLAQVRDLYSRLDW